MAHELDVTVAICALNRRETDDTAKAVEGSIATASGGGYHDAPLDHQNVRPK